MYQTRRRTKYASKSGRQTASAALSRVSRSQALAARRNWMVVTSGTWGAQGELKAIDTDLSSDAVCSNGALIACINPCSQGTDIGTRVGRQITMKSVQIRGEFLPNGTNPGDLVFWAVVYDRQTNTAAPGWADVYTTSALQPQLRNLDNRKRFKVLGSGYIALPKAGADLKFTPFEFYRKLNHPVEFNATNGGTVLDIVSGGLFFLIRGASASGDDDYSIQAASRVRYSDT